MLDFPKKSIVSKSPVEYLKQGWGHCGAFSVRAILQAYGKDNGKLPQDYHRHWLGKLTGTTVGFSYWPDLLRSYGLKVEVGNTKDLSDEERLNVLRGFLTRDVPVMISVGNGYLPNGKYSRLVASLVGHWITLWGYNDKKSAFYVYDPAVPKHLYDKDISVGNKTRTYSEVLRDWGAFGLLPFPRRYLYIVAHP